MIVDYSIPDDRNREPSPETALPPNKVPKLADDETRTVQMDSNGDEPSKSGLANNGAVTSNTDVVCYVTMTVTQYRVILMPLRRYNNPFMIFRVPWPHPYIRKAIRWKLFLGNLFVA